MTDRHAIFMRTVGGLAPHNEAASEQLRGLALGAKVKVQISRPRNIGAHNLYWAMCSMIADAVPGDYTAENVSDVLKLKVGHVTRIQTKRGIVEIPRSISFAKMDGAAFSAFLDRCVKVVSEEFLPHMTPSQVKAELEDMLQLAA